MKIQEQQISGLKQQVNGEGCSKEEFNQMKDELFETSSLVKQMREDIKEITIEKAVSQVVQQKTKDFETKVVEKKPFEEIVKDVLLKEKINAKTAEKLS